MTNKPVLSTDVYRDVIHGLFGQIEAEYSSLSAFCRCHEFVRETLQRNKKFKQDMSVGEFNRICEALNGSSVTPGVTKHSNMSLRDYLQVDCYLVFRNVLFYSLL